MYHVKSFFEAYPKAKEGFETYDGVIHATQAIADKWIERHANKKVTRHVNPALEEKPSAGSAGSIKPPRPSKPADGKPASGKPATRKPASGKPVAVVPAADQGEPGASQEGGGDPGTGTPATPGDNQ